MTYPFGIELEYSDLTWQQARVGFTQRGIKGWKHDNDASHNVTGETISCVLAMGDYAIERIQDIK